MKKYLVIGNPIKHSLSPLIHNYWMRKHKLVDSVYEKRKVEEKDLKNLIQEIKDNEIIGMNVTIPFKQLIIPFLDELDSTAKETKSVNTIYKVQRKIIGCNTDSSGFFQTITNFIPSETSKSSAPIHKKHVFILGAGGVTSSIIYALYKHDLKITVSNRTRKKAEELKKNFPKINVLDWGHRPSVFDIVINTTSVGLAQNDKIDINFNDCDENENKLFYDLIYNPKETNFLKEARLRGNKTVNGQMMFLNQAIYAFNLWTNITPKIDEGLVKLLD